MFKYYTSIFVILLMVISWVRPAMAQMEIEQERSSLHGLKGVGFVVNVEQNSALSDSQLVKIERIRKQGRQILRKSDIHLYSDEVVRSSTRIPVLYAHINLLSTQEGIISFAVTASLYQPVKLTLSGDKRMAAVTWEDSEVGIASYDKIAVIYQSARGLIKSFIDAYDKANSG
jgi:hypothetical protein